MKQSYRLLGIAFALAAGAYFLVYMTRAFAHQDLGQLLQPRVMLAALALTLLYVLLVPITALAWTWLLRGLGQHAPFSLTAPILATTQFGKYLPGNVAHHLGRVVIARNLGPTTAAVMMSMAYETLLTLVACAHVSALTMLWTLPSELGHWPLARYRALLVIGISAAAIATMLVVPLLARAIVRLRAPATAVGNEFQSRPGWRIALACYGLYVANFFLVGVGLWIVARALSGGAAEPSLLLLVGAFASSWILGFLAPGAPAGLGVREAVLVLWLGSSLAPAIAATLIMTLRLATTLGDLVNFAWGSPALRRLTATRTGQH